MSNDQEAVYAECRQAQAEGREISDACARVIASWWHNGQGSPGYAFVSTGAYGSSTDLWRDLTDNGREYDRADADDRLALDMLGTYLLNRDDRGPVPGWSRLWVR